MSAESLRLHTGPRGTVWYGDANVLADDSGLVPDAFFETPRFREARVVKVLGRADAAGLVTAVHGCKARGRLDPATKVHLGSPLISAAVDPTTVLRDVWHAAVCADAGGQWYTLTNDDYTAYALTAEVHANAGRVTDKARRLMHYHPAWPALAFVPGHDVDACCRMLAAIVDVRWFVHTDRPNRATKLYAFLGLTPANVAAMLATLPSPGHVPVTADRHYARAVDAVTAWLGCPPDLLTATLPGSAAAGDFLRRVFFAGDSRVRGTLTATQRFVRFVREVWMSERAGRRNHFDPEAFFNGHEEVTAYAEHLRTLYAGAENRTD